MANRSDYKSPPLLERRARLALSDFSYKYHVEQAYTLGYIRNNNTAYGIGYYLSALSNIPAESWQDRRPDYLLNTSQWYQGDAPVRGRTLSLFGDTASLLCRTAWLLGVVPYRAQIPILAGQREQAPRKAPMYVWAAHAATATSDALTRAALLEWARRHQCGEDELIGPFLEAVGLRWLRTSEPIAYAPPTLYAQPSRKTRANSPLTDPYA